MSNRSRPVSIGIAGGTGSGKTTFARALLEQVGAESMAYLPHDRYYKNINHIPLHVRRIRNFDHPHALDTEILIRNIQDLQQGKPSEAPIYDFREHQRMAHTETVQPQPIILVEGILIFSEARLRDLFDVKVFLDADADIRFIRRLQRDIAERGRTVESVIEQYLKTVQPMHLEFVEPSKRYADVIVPVGGMNTVALDMVTDRIRNLLARSTHDS